MYVMLCFFFFFFFNDTATTEIYTLSLHDALPIFFFIGAGNLLLAIFNLFPGYPLDGGRVLRAIIWKRSGNIREATRIAGDRKSTRLNSSHDQISYAVFCLKKKKKYKYI